MQVHLAASPHAGRHLESITSAGDVKPGSVHGLSLDIKLRVINGGPPLPLHQHYTSQEVTGGRLQTGVLFSSIKYFFPPNDLTYKLRGKRRLSILT